MQMNTAQRKAVGQSQQLWLEAPEPTVKGHIMPVRQGAGKGSKRARTAPGQATRPTDLQATSISLAWLLL